MVSTGSTATPESGTSAQVGESADGIAARRRHRKAAKPAEHPTGAAPQPVRGAEPVAVVASRTLVSSVSGASTPARPTGGVWLGEPLVLETQPHAVGGVAVESPLYVIADCDAEERVVPPNCRTATVRTLWRRGNRVRRDLYEAVMAAHAAKLAAGQDPSEAEPAGLPEGVDQLPAEVIRKP